MLSLIYLKLYFIKCILFY